MTIDRKPHRESKVELQGFPQSDGHTNPKDASVLAFPLSPLPDLMNLIIGDRPHPKPSPCLKAIEAQAGWMDERPSRARHRVGGSDPNADLTRASSVEGGRGEGI